MTQKDVLTSIPQIPHANVGQHIGYEKGAKMIKDYFDLHGENSCRFVGRNILEKMLSQPDCIGINIYKALNDQGVQTYVFVGVDSAGKAILEYTYVNDGGELDKVPGIVANQFSPRPGWWSWSL
ncbi:MAG: hypothetical protein KF746_15390 [Chitinophagaceae bacterium]|nr:hypothetical protein [Chitinophagaceae bacterium]